MVKWKRVMNCQLFQYVMTIYSKVKPSVTTQGAAYKVRHARGRGFEKMWQFVRGSRRHTLNFTFDKKIYKWYLTLCCNRCILKEGGTDKTFQTKDPGQKPSRTIEREFVQGLLSGFFVLDLLKIGGVREVWRAFGGFRDVWQSVTGVGIKIGQK